MAETRPAIVSTSGARRTERLLKALLPGYVSVNERTLTQYMSMGAQYAEMVYYYNQDDLPDGDWKAFFQNDQSIFIAIIATTDINSFEANLEMFTKATGSSDSDSQLLWYQLISGFIADWALTVDRWFNQLTILRETGMATEIENCIINQLAPALHSLQLISSVISLEPVPAVPFNQLGVTWMSSQSANPVLLIDLRKGEPGEITQFSEAFWEGLKQVYKKFQSTLNYLVGKAPAYLSNSLKKSNHNPNNALFIAFLKLFQHAKADINTITKRELDYYYRDVLRLTYLDGSPDWVYVAFQLVQGVDYSLVPKGTLLAAGKSASGLDIQFSTLSDLVVDNSVVSTMRTLYVDNTSLFSAGTDEPIVSNIFMAPIANSQDGMGTALKDPAAGWPTFGLGQADIDKGGITMPVATTGFIISSPVLLLNQGSRQVSLDISFINLQLEGTQGTLNDLLGQMATNNDTSIDAAIYQVFDKAFLVYVTTANGWEQVPSYSSTFDLELMQLELGFLLDASFPAVVSNAGCLVNSDGEAEYPAVKVELDNNATIYAYSFLNGLIINEINIGVDVSNIKDLVLYNQVGKLVPDKPFQPFGPVPEVGNYLMIGYPEVFQKNLVNVSFDIAWAGLPAENGGFETYYEGYNLGVTNDAFKVRLSVLANNNWIPAQPSQRQEFDLFETIEQDLGNGPETILSTTTEWDDVNMKLIAFPPVESLPTPLVYNAYTQSGFFKFEFTAPSYGFGQKQYPNALTNITVYNARNKENVPLPNPPFVPVISQMTMSYQANHRMILTTNPKYSDPTDETGAVYHIHPFGVHCACTADNRGEIPLLCALNLQGSLFLGLKNIDAPGLLTLYFEFAGQEVPLLQGFVPALTWSYLSDNEWIDFKASEIISDSTSGFLASGIVELQISRNMTLGNTIFPSDQYWIRIGTNNWASRFPQLINIYTNAVKAQWVNNGDTARLGTPVPAGTIQKIAGKLSDIKTVIQPQESMEGIPPEDETGFYTRVSERLRHKDRAVTSWDVERLVLQNFTDIFDVKCANLSSEFGLTAGAITVAVVPQNTDMNVVGTPMVNAATLVEIKDYLQGLSDPFVSITVRNPIYEKLLINCEVLFSQGDQSGYYLRLLNEDLGKFLSPWYNDAGLKLSFGGSVDLNAILTFMDGLPYVENVTAFSVEQIVERDGKFQLIDSASKDSPKTILTATTPWSILTSVDTHRLKMLMKETMSPPKPAGIGTMEIGQDLILTGETFTLPGALQQNVQMLKSRRPGSSAKQAGYYRLKVTPLNTTT